MELLRNLRARFQTTPPPRGFVSVQDLAKTGIPYKEIYPAQTYRCQLPGTIHEQMDQRFLDDQQYTTTPNFAALLPRGRVIGQEGYVITDDNLLLSEVSLEYLKPIAEHSLLLREKMPRLLHKSGTVAVLGTRGQNIYFHWLFDTIVRLHLIEEMGIRVDRYVVNTHVPCQRESLAMLGIPKSKIIRCGSNSYFEADNLLVLSRPTSVDNMASWTCSYLRKVLLRKDLLRPGGPKRIFIDRQFTGSKRVVNQDSVMGFLETLGFVSVATERLSLEEQINLFHGAEVIVGPHGSATTNMVFSNPGTKLIDISPGVLVNPTFWHMAQLIGLEYYYLFAKGIPSEAREIHRDMELDLGDLKATLELAGVA